MILSHIALSCLKMSRRIENPENHTYGPPNFWKIVLKRREAIFPKVVCLEKCAEP